MCRRRASDNVPSQNYMVRAIRNFAGANPYSCEEYLFLCFGGKYLNELYITSARLGLVEAALTRYPLAGGLFRRETKVEEMPTFEFTG